MPSKSGPQHRLMEMVAHGGKVKNGPSVSVAKEFVKADTGRTFSKTVSKRHANDKGGYQADKVAAIPGRQPEY
jgi:hypothetical protein